jgi:hypothetical protein
MLLMSSIPELLVRWQSYYVIIGSSGAALTGLQFVVMALIAESPFAANAGEEGVAAFGSPIVVHFCAALLLSAMLSAPWPAGPQIAAAVDLFGVAGMLYVLNVVRRARRQSAYKMVFEDWLWHIILPFASYTTFLVAGLMLPARPATALFVAAIAPAALLYIGIHNAWDSITYTVLRSARAKADALADAKVRAALSADSVDELRNEPQIKP